MIAARLVVRFNNLPRGAALLRSGLPEVVTKAAADGAERARGYAPVDTGELRSSIGHRSTGAASAEFFAGAEHAKYQEFGTAHQPGTPHMRPAAEAVKPGLEAAIRSLLGGLA